MYVIGVFNEDGVLKIGRKILDGGRKVGVGYGMEMLSGKGIEERGLK